MSADGTIGATPANDVAEVAATAPAEAVIKLDQLNEASLIGTVVRDWALMPRVMLTVRSGHFQTREAHAAWEVLLEAHRRGVVPDEIGLRSLTDARTAKWMFNCGRFASGVNLDVLIATLQWDAARIQASRGPLKALLAAMANSKSEPDQVRAYAKQLVLSLQGVGAAAAVDPVRDVGAMMRELVDTRPRRRASTGDAHLDAVLGGGLCMGSVVCIAGAPDAQKTALGLQIAHVAAMAGTRTVYLAADEPAPMIVARIAQRMGVPRADVDARGPALRELAHHTMMSLPLQIADDETTVEDAVEALGDLPGVLVVDTVQYARSAARSGAVDRRAEVDAVTAAAKKAAKRGHLVVLLSEAHRALYRSRASAKDAEALASAKESSSTEYIARTLLVLRQVRGEHRVSTAEIAKAKDGGRRGDVVRLVCDETTTHVHAEPDSGADSDEQGADVDGAILAAVEGGATSANAVARAVGGTRSVVLSRVRVLRETGVLTSDRLGLSVTRGRS